MGRQLEQLNLWGNPETCNYTNRLDCYFSGCPEVSGGTCERFSKLPEYKPKAKGGKHGK